MAIGFLTVLAPVCEFDSCYAGCTVDARLARCAQAGVKPFFRDAFAIGGEDPR